MGDIWANMYELPLIETAELLEPQHVMALPAMQPFIGKLTVVKSVSSVYKHVLTHQHLFVRFIELEETPEVSSGEFIFTEVKKLKNLALPQIIFIFLTNFLN
jgi:A/G-specific adenine glycosylase